MGGGIVQGGIPGPVPAGLNIFETMRVEADGAIALWRLHLARMRRGCALLGFPLDEARVEAVLAGLPRGRVLRARLSVDAEGEVGISHADLPPDPPSWRVALSRWRLRSDDPWLSVKTTHRPAYDAARADLAPGVDEALLLNERGEVCEGSITSIFLRGADGMLLTPPLSCGVLPGVLRASLIERGHAREAVLRVEDLARGPFLCGNSLRGLIPAVLADPGAAAR